MATDTSGDFTILVAAVPRVTFFQVPHPNRMMHEVRGRAVLSDPSINKSTAFSVAERDQLGLRGLLPPQVGNQDVQIARVLGNLRRKSHDIERYVFLTALQGRNERLYYRTLLDHIDEIMPLVYTPTVGQACKEFAHLFRESRGFYISSEDRGRVREMLDNWPERDIRVIVITDGERILGLGDLGTNGMGIPIGKLALYTACSGIDPAQCLPIQLDVGTDNEELLNDPLYLGLSQRRVRGDEYYELMDEVVAAVRDAFPKALLQFEDFLSPNAYALLARYRDSILCFNDDIQGTAAVVLAGIQASVRITGVALRDQTVLFLGAGSAATGIADLLTVALQREGLSLEEARGRLWFADRAGLLVAGRTDLQAHNAPYIHDSPQLGFLEALEVLRPHTLIGATGHHGAFGQEAIVAMARNHERPVVFALSNPTSKAECTAQQAYDWSEGRVVFASGSPFPGISRPDGSVWTPGQGNNAYIFPGIGLGAVGCGASTVSDGMFLAAAAALANSVKPMHLERGALYPPLSEIRQVSLAIAAAVAETAYEEGVATYPKPDDLELHLADSMYDPTY